MIQLPDIAPAVEGAEPHSPSRQLRSGLQWVLGGIVTSLALAGCVTDLNPTGAPRTPIPTATVESIPADSGPSFNGKQAKDFATYAGNGITYKGGVTVTSSTLSQYRRNGRYLCTDVTMTNANAESESFSSGDWKLQDPRGVIRNATTTLSNVDLDFGELARGGSISGKVCFDDDSKTKAAPSGTWIVLMEPEFFSSERLAWVNDFSSATTSAETAPPTSTTTTRTTTTSASPATTATTPRVESPSTSTGLPPGPPMGAEAPLPPPMGYSASITGTCDQQGRCSGVQQRTKPQNNSPQIVPEILAEGATVKIACQTQGELKIETDHAPSNLWYRLANGAYINSIYITPPGTGVPLCG
jgi:hypothetical protein